MKLRPRKDLVETLLHEMIHAYLFVTDGDDDHDGHGPGTNLPMLGHSSIFSSDSAIAEIMVLLAGWFARNNVDDTIMCKLVIWVNSYHGYTHVKDWLY